jgi:tetratricopeptide (TPR) repeat protein
VLAAASILWLLLAQGEPAGYATAARAFAAHDFASADAAVNEALHEHPGYVPALLLKARLSMVEGRMDEAVVALQRAISEDPAGAEPKFLLGFAYYLENNFDQADGALANADQKDARVLPYRASGGSVKSVIVVIEPLHEGVYQYCYPISYDAWLPKLYRNNWDGTFEEIGWKPESVIRMTALRGAGWAWMTGTASPICSRRI